MIRAATIPPGDSSDTRQDRLERWLEPWIPPREAATILGEDEDVIREKMRLGMIHARDIARPGQVRRQWRTTASWLALYQQANAVAKTQPGVPGRSETGTKHRGSSPPRLFREVSYAEFKKWPRAEQDAYLQEIAMRG